MHAVPYLLAFAATTLFLSLFPAAVVALASGETEIAEKMVLQAVVGGAVALLVLAAGYGKSKVLSRYDGFVAIVSVWLVAPVLAAWVFVWVGEMSVMNALFEAVGALTTSGASTFTERSAIPTALLFWRVELEWLGGYLTLMGIIEILAPAGLGGLPQSTAVFRRRFRVAIHDTQGRFLGVFGQYFLATAVVTVLMMLTGSAFSDAAMLSMITLATGGFVPFDESILERIGTASTAILAIGLCVGATSVFWRQNIVRSPRLLARMNPETLWVFGIIGALAVFFASRLVAVAGTATTSAPTAVVEGLFAAASLVSTSGLQTRHGVFALAPEIVVLFTVYIGASIYSTAGGIKLYRIGAMGLQASQEIERLVYPSSVAPLKVGGRILSRASMRAVWVYFFLMLSVTAAGMAVAAVTLDSFDASFAYAVALVSNAAPVYEALAPTSGNWPALSEQSVLSQLAGMALMVLGRLEILAVFAVFNIRYWMQR